MLPSKKKKDGIDAVSWIESSHPQSEAIGFGEDKKSNKNGWFGQRLALTKIIRLSYRIINFCAACFLSVFLINL